MLGILTKTLSAESSLPSPASSEIGYHPSKKFRAAEAEYSLPTPATPPSCDDEEDEVSHPYVANRAGSVRKCNYCGVTSTPMWRHGPGNYANLCNSCGVKWRRGKILATGDNRHHLCKPPTPKKPTKIVKPKPEISSAASKLSKRKACETSLQTTTLHPSLSPSSKKVTDLDRKVAALTNEFADLLESLPVSRTAEFTTILANCFGPKVTAAYQAGIEVEMSVLDVTPETWEMLRAIVSK